MEDQSSIELLLKNIIKIVDKLEKDVATKNERYTYEFESLRAEIAKLSVFSRYEEVLDVLASNVSPNGLKKLIEDVDRHEKFITAQEASAKEASGWSGRAWAVGGPIAIFILGVIWFFVKYVLSGGTLK